MPFSIPFPFLLAQSAMQDMPVWVRAILNWLLIFGDPNSTIRVTSTATVLVSGLITWFKVISLFCLLGWLLSWLATGLRERQVTKGDWLDIAAVVALVAGIGAVLMSVLEQTKRIPIYKLGGVYSVNLIAMISVFVLFLWLERGIWATVRRFGKKGDYTVTLGVHFALALGLVIGLLIRVLTNRALAGTTNPGMSLAEGLLGGLRIGATYMGYIVLFKVIALLLRELPSVRWRRLYSIASVSVIEANRRMWAPWVVITIFLVILAFTHWFLQAPRAAEMGRLFVGTLSLLCSLLITVMITLLTPLSLPQDIQNQTIYTVVSKPVRRIELVWGRMLGFMSIVTVLVLVFGGISLAYLSRTVGSTITATEAAAARALKANKITEATQLHEQAEQIRTRMAARVPLYGSLTFLDSKGDKHLRGIDVGAEQSAREPRSHIEGATPATAIWSYGLVPDPFTPAGARPAILDHRIPLDLLIDPNSVEGLQSRTYDLKYQIDSAERQESAGDVAAGKVKDLSASLTRLREEQKRATEAYNALKARADDFEAKAAAAEKAGNKNEASALRRQAAGLHSAPVPIEMTFNVYRTTKGKVGEPVYAELEVKNPFTGAEYRNIFAIREYYTNRQVIPASILAGSNGALRVEVRCISPTQYLGMAQSDLFILARSGDFGTNFMKGLFGIWLQAMVLTAIGVFAGTFLSWPVALLTTIAFFIAGEVAFTSLIEFTRQSIEGGGPFESLIRMVTHENLVSELTPTLAVVTAKTLDAIVVPVLSRLVYVVPNFAALDVTETVAGGFAVTWPLLGVNTLLALAYTIPFSIAGYFILKNREVAA